MSLRLLSTLLGMLALCGVGRVEGSDVRIELFRGAELKPYIEEVAALCNAVYREPPYFYDGTAVEYTDFLASYAQLDSALVCVAFDGDQIVGAATGKPMANNRQVYQQPFVDNGMDLDRLFYHGELVLLPAYRGQGLGTKLYQKLEDAVVAEAHYTSICFCQLEPAGTIPNQIFWSNLGFERQPDLVFVVDWRNVGDAEETPHQLTYWTKYL